MNLINELFYFEKLREDLNNLTKPDMYVVYKVSGPDTDHVYYGYCRGDTDEAMRDAFMIQTKKRGGPEELRGIKRLVDENGGVDNLKFEAIDVADDEIDAHFLRDKAREENSDISITRPSPFPPKIWKASQERHANYFAQRAANKLAMKNQQKIEQLLSRYKTPHDAYANGIFDKKAMAELRSNSAAKKDFGVLSAIEFAKKYPQVMQNLPQ